MTKTDLGLPVTFNATIGGGPGPFVYVWSFGDGTTSPVAAPSHTYESGGNQTVTLQVLGPNDTSGISSATVDVAYALAVAGPNIPPSGVVGSPVAFQVTVANGFPAYTYFWTFGDLNSSHDAAPSHSYSRPGTYDVTVFVNDSVGGQAQFSELVLVTGSGHGASGSANSSGSTTHPVYFWVSAGFAIAAAAIIVAIGFTPSRR